MGNKPVDFGFVVFNFVGPEKKFTFYSRPVVRVKRNDDGYSYQ